MLHRARQHRLGVEPTNTAAKAEAREKVLALGEKYSCTLTDALIEDITVGMRQLPDPQDALPRENGPDLRRADRRPHPGRSTSSCRSSYSPPRQEHPLHLHKLAGSWRSRTAARCCARANASARSRPPTPQRRSCHAMMVGRSVSFHVDEAVRPGEDVLGVEGMTIASKLHKNNAVRARFAQGPPRQIVPCGISAATARRSSSTA